eukprot:NODE_165_length_2944_cov_61.626598_g151_i0.p1 GENE.NODE_165_length_2944_cov_61.626598_g151_i0~~NODE_165_length_2944_cov_61.626598_g151_i0.p1  ORF type:complete len:431 (+),score=39.96 NODE_165_length_2944_cov_61.626598_g151_i0:538-1830(+)
MFAERDDSATQMHSTIPTLRFNQVVLEEDLFPNGKGILRKDDAGVSRKVTRSAVASCLIILSLAVFFIARRGQSNSTFLLSFPVYYRAVALLVLGGWCWGWNVRLLDRYAIDYAQLFEMDGTRHSSRSIFCLSSVFTLLLLFNVCLFSNATAIPSTFLPMCLYVSVLLVLWWPKGPFRDIRYSLLSSCHSVLFSPFLGVHFMHVIVADLLTSYAKVFHDLYSSLCVIGSSSDQRFHVSLLQACRSDPTGLLVASLPSWLRLTQCLSCYLSDHERKHLANSAKYASAFPVLLFSYLHQEYTDHPLQSTFQTCWLASLCVNSAFSFYWDVYNDWGLGTSRNSQLLLRDRLLFPSYWYYLAVLVDLVLRFTWSLQLSPHWYLYLGDVGRELQMFLLESVEILRRCMWIIFRMEWQLISKEKHLVVPELAACSK